MTEADPSPWPTLPPELLKLCIADLPAHDLTSVALLCRSWTPHAQSLLYRYPHLHNQRHARHFGWSISNNADLREYVWEWDAHLLAGADVGQIVQVLPTLKNLRRFVAPQGSLTTPFVNALGACMNLLHLDLEWIIERYDLGRVINSIAKLQRLHTFEFSRCAQMDRMPVKSWPPKLQSLHLRGGVPDAFIYTAPWPTTTIRTIRISHLPNTRPEALLHFLATFGPIVEELRIDYPLYRLKPSSLDTVFELIGDGIREVGVSADYVSDAAFRGLVELSGRARGLREVRITWSGVTRRDMVSARDLLRVLGVSVAALPPLFFPSGEPMAELSTESWHESIKHVPGGGAKFKLCLDQRLARRLEADDAVAWGVLVRESRLSIDEGSSFGADAVDALVQRIQGMPYGLGR
ncbi:hypothetical protein YB2330_001783 [Saitoella coloradoensis]